jgi:predicted nucleic acid-binding Zn finger protein
MTTHEFNNQLYHIVYLTTNKVNLKMYVGIHQTYILNDNYLGSGLLLNKAIKKYGKENFERKILFYCFSRKEANEIESRIVDTNFILRKDTYNIKMGGENGNHSIETKLKISIKGKGKIRSEDFKNKLSLFWLGKLKEPRTQQHCLNLSKALKNVQWKPKTKEHIENVRQSQIGKKATNAAKINMSEARKRSVKKFHNVTAYIFSLFLLKEQIKQYFEITPHSRFYGSMKKELLSKILTKFETIV